VTNASAPTPASDPLSPRPNQPSINTKERKMNKTCLVCNTPFSFGSRPRKVYCSAACQADARKLRENKPALATYRAVRNANMSLMRAQGMTWAAIGAFYQLDRKNVRLAVLKWREENEDNSNQQNQPRSAKTLGKRASIQWS
jgi:hypothetical protein